MVDKVSVAVGTGVGIALGVGLALLANKAYTPTVKVPVGGVVKKNFPTWVSGRTVEQCMADEMRNAVLRGKDDQVVRALAISIIKDHNLDGRQFYEVASAIQYWVMTHVTYVPDTVGTEIFQEGHYTISNGAGDCDDQAILTASLLMSVGIPCRLLLMSQDYGGNLDAAHFTHVLSAAIINGQEIPLETIIPYALPEYLHPCTAVWRIEINNAPVGLNVEVNPPTSEGLPVPGEADAP